MQRAQQCWK